MLIQIGAHQLGQAVKIELELGAALLEHACINMLDSIGVFSGVERDLRSMCFVHGADANVMHVVRGSRTRFQAARNFVIKQGLLRNVRLDARFEP